MDVLKTVAIDIREFVFENDSEGILYITKDIYNDTFVVSVPIYTFSSAIWQGNEERDLKDIYDTFPLGNTDRKEKLIQVIKDGIASFNG